MPIREQIYLSMARMKLIINRQILTWSAIGIKVPLGTFDRIAAEQEYGMAPYMQDQGLSEKVQS